MSHATAHPEGLDTVLADANTQPISTRRAHSYRDSALTFEQWLNRPVYLTQCKTWAAAKMLGVCCIRFRSLPGYRDDEAKHARKLVADWMRKERQRIAL